MRLRKITSNRILELEFTNELDFPNLEDFNEENSDSDNKLLNVSMISGNDYDFDDNLLSWKLVELTPTLMKIKIEFN